MTPLNDDEKAELVAYLDGELDEAATQAMETRLATDPAARAEMDTLKQTWGMLDYLPKASPSSNFTNRTMDKLTLENFVPTPAAKTQPMPSRSRPWIVAAGWAAVVVVAVVVGFFAVSHLAPAPTHADPQHDPDLPFVRHLRIVEKWRWYENIDDLDFAKKLAHPEMFGDDPS
ncbi:MAG: hypothetical protein EXS16_17715 [Gemmataceae bacterium]|nr:hypothetical protein [Gemmataceae bacterium]